MTLILGMSKPEGIYLSTDHRVTEYPSGRLVDDAAVKFLTVHFPPHDSGPKALVAHRFGGYRAALRSPFRSPDSGRTPARFGQGPSTFQPSSRPPVRPVMLPTGGWGSRSVVPLPGHVASNQT